MIRNGNHRLDTQGRWLRILTPLLVLLILVAALAGIGGVWFSVVQNQRLSQENHRLNEATLTEIRRVDDKIDAVCAATRLQCPPPEP